MYDQYLDEDKLPRTLTPTWGELWHVFKLKVTIWRWNHRIISWKKVKNIIKAIWLTTCNLQFLNFWESVAKTISTENRQDDLLDYMTSLEIEAAQLRCHNITKHRRVW